jgi:hypothetical protein
MKKYFKENRKKEGVHFSAFRKTKTLLKKLSRSTANSDKFSSITNVYPKNDVKTRWKSTFDSLQSIIKVPKEKLKQGFLAIDLQFYTATEYGYLLEFLKTIAPICDSIDRMQKEIHSYYGEFMPTITSLFAKLTNLTNLTYCDGLRNHLLVAMKRRFPDLFMDAKSLHFSPNTSFITSVLAAVVHPFFKSRWLKCEKMIDFAKKEIVKKMVLLSKTNCQEVSPDKQTNADGFF